ncbi:MAG: DUF5719 family protein [Actinomycetota bacterium]
MTDVEPQSGSQRSSRSGLIGVIVLMLIAAAITVDRIQPVHASHPVAVIPEHPGGLLACPFLYAGNGESWMHFANSGTVSSKITMTTVRDKAPPLFKTFSLDAGHAQTIPLDASVHQPAGAIVEFAGGEVAASRTSTFSSEAHWKGSGAAPCTKAGQRMLVIPSGSTLNAETTVILLNPGTSDANADVSFLSGGDENAPVSLKNIVVPARERTTVRVSDFEFDQKSVSTVVHVHTGVLAADGIESSANGITLSPAVELGSESSGVAPADVAALSADVVSYGDNDTVLDGSIMTEDGATAFANLTQDLVPDSPAQATPSIPKASILGADLGVRQGSPFAADFRWVVRLRNGKSAVASAMMIQPANRMLAVTGDPASGGQSRILIGNPNDSDATVRLEVLTPSGRNDSIFKDRVIRAGGVISIPAGTINGTFGVLALGTQPIVMTLSSTIVTKDVVAFAITGLPEPTGQAAFVREDPRLAIPAPINS